MRILAATVFAMLLGPNGFAGESIPAKHSRVHIVFVTSVAQPAMQSGGGGGMGGIGFSGPMARIGDLILPVAAISPIRITIDGDFVGHAMVGSRDIKPVFILPEGNRKFTFTLDKGDPIKAELTVLGTGSTQYLVVRLPTVADPLDDFVPADDTSIAPDLDE